MRWVRRVAKKSSRILDQGTGIGQYPFSLYREGYRNIVGLDFSKELIKSARKNTKKLGYPVRFVEGDIRKMPFKKYSFDVVISAGIVEHVPETEKTIQELSRVIKERGYLIIHVPHRISIFTITKTLQKILGFWKCGYEKSFTKGDFSKLLEKYGFEILDYELKKFIVGKHKIIGGILAILDKPFYLLGLGGHHMCFLCRKS